MGGRGLHLVVVVRDVVVISCVVLQVQDGRLGALQGRAWDAAVLDEDDKMLALLWNRALCVYGRCTYLSGMLSHSGASLAWSQGQRCWLPARPRCPAAAAAAAIHPPAGGVHHLLVVLVLNCSA